MSIRNNRRDHYANLPITGNFADYLPLENGDTGELESDYIEVPTILTEYDDEQD